MSSNTTTFYVESGNWRVKVILDVKPESVDNYDYIEAATIAMESVFDERKEFGDKVEMVHLFDKNGNDYFDVEYSGQLSDIPSNLFGLLTASFLEKDINTPENWWYFLSSKIFANAGQHRNVELATAVEANYKKEVDNFKLQEQELVELDKSGKLQERLEEERLAHQKNRSNSKSKVKKSPKIPKKPKSPEKPPDNNSPPL